MTFKNMQDELTELRFNSNLVPKVKRWINTKELQVWAAFDWPFKHVAYENLSITSGDNTPTLPSGFFKLAKGGLQDDLGNLLGYMEPHIFQNEYVGSSNTTTGRPQDYTFLNGVMYLGPTPDTNYTFKISYDRNYVHNDVNGAATSGVMSVDSDYPLWDSGFHYVLVAGAMALGLKLENDPTYGPLEEEFNGMLLRMADHYLPPDRSENLQYGADMLGYEI